MIPARPIICVPALRHRSGISDHPVTPVNMHGADRSVSAWKISVMGVGPPAAPDKDRVDVIFQINGAGCICSCPAGNGGSTRIGTPRGETVRQRERKKCGDAQRRIGSTAKEKATDRPRAARTPAVLRRAWLGRMETCGPIIRSERPALSTTARSRLSGRSGLRPMGFVQ